MTNQDGARLVNSFEINYQGENLDYVALYQDADGKITALIDTFRGGKWNSVLLLPDTADQLRKALNKAHRQRRSQ